MDNNDGWISVKNYRRRPPKFKNVLMLSKCGVIRISCIMSNGKFDDYELETDEGDKWAYRQPLLSPPKTSDKNGE